MDLCYKETALYFQVKQTILPTEYLNGLVSKMVCLIILLLQSWVCVQTDMGLDVTKPIFEVSDNVRLKPVSSATETS